MDGARSLAAALEAAGQDVPDSLRDIASGSTLAAGADLQHAQGVLNEAFGRLLDRRRPARQRLSRIWQDAWLRGLRG